MALSEALLIGVDVTFAPCLYAISIGNLWDLSLIQSRLLYLKGGFFLNKESSKVTFTCQHHVKVFWYI